MAGSASPARSSSRGRRCRAVGQRKCYVMFLKWGIHPFHKRSGRRADSRKTPDEFRVFFKSGRRTDPGPKLKKVVSEHLKGSCLVVRLVILWKYSKMTILVAILGAGSWMYHTIFLQPLNRFLISIAFWNALIPSFHFRGRKKESSD